MDSGFALRAPRNDELQTYVLILATGFCPSFAVSFAPLRGEGAGKAGCAPHPRSRVQWGSKEDAHEQTGLAEAVRPSLRNGFPAYAVFSLVTGFLTPSLSEGVNLPGT